MRRREFIRCAGMCAGGLATFGFPKVQFASTPGSGRLLFVLLRGGFDGLAALAPTFDPAYESTRGQLAVPASELVELADGFALTPGLGPLLEFWDRDEMLALHAMAIPYRSRSHFDSQAILETGLDAPQGSADGWLNRLVGLLGGENTGLAVAAGLPRSLSGEAPVTTWSPAQLGVVEGSYLERLHLLYRTDEMLQGRFEAALSQQELAGGMEGGGRGRAAVDGLFQAAARLMTVEGGPNVAAMEMSGWDTHVNQGLAGGPLDQLLARLADGLVAFREEMADGWEGTTVVVMTEFGRTARPNGSGGSDHGTAAAGFVFGSGVAKSQVVADWPGLGESHLFEGRDLAPTMETRAVLKGVLAGTFDLTAAQTNQVFPGSEATPGMWDLMA